MNIDQAKSELEELLREIKIKKELIEVNDTIVSKFLECLAQPNEIHLTKIGEYIAKNKEKLSAKMLESYGNIYDTFESDIGVAVGEVLGGRKING